MLMNILLLLSGVGVFLVGMGKMSEGLKASAGNGVRSLLNRISSNRVAGYGIGIGATAIVQSSSATAIMTIGLANAKIVNTRQGASIILGAKVGTTLTAFIFALSGLSKGGFSVGILFASMAFVGAIFLMIAKTEKQKNIATFLLGFGMLFLGMEVMDIAISDTKGALGEAIAVMFKNPLFKNPLLLILIGLVFTSIIQSSSAATAIFITLLRTQVLDSVDQSFFLVLGANIGTCSDGLMASIGANADGKRLAWFHVITSTLGAVVFGTITVALRKPIIGFFESVIVRPDWSLAIFNLFYNLGYTLMLLPALPFFVSLMERLVKEGDKPKSELQYLNPQILATPVMAMTQAKREIVCMGKKAAANLNSAFNALVNGDTSMSADIFKQEDALNTLNREISDYLIKMSSVVNSMKSEAKIGAFHHVINDIERIGDHAKNFMVYTIDIVASQDCFTEQSIEDLKMMYAKVSQSLELSIDIFEHNSKRRLPEISKIEKEIDAMHKTYSKEHFKRLHEKSGWAEVQMYYDIISELERIGDHTINVAFSIISPTGQEKMEGVLQESSSAQKKRTTKKHAPKEDEE